MDEKKDKMQEETELDLTNNESSRKAVWAFFIIVLIIGLLYWAWNSLPSNIQSDVTGQSQTQTQVDPVAAYDSYQDKLDRILSNVPKETDHAENMKVITEVLELQKQVTENKEAFKLPDGSYQNYDDMQAKIDQVLGKYKAKVVEDDESLYNYAQVDFKTADQYSVEKGLKVMTELMNNLQADAKVTNVFPTEQDRDEFTKKAQERYDQFEKRAAEMKAENK